MGAQTEPARFNLLPWRARLDHRRTVFFTVLWAGTLIVALGLQALWFVQSIGESATWSARDWSNRLLERETLHRSLQTTVADQAPAFDHHQAQIEAHRQAGQTLTDVAMLTGGSTDSLKAWVAMRPAGVWIDSLTQTHQWPSLDGTAPFYATVRVEGHAIQQASVERFWQQWQRSVFQEGEVRGEVSVVPLNDQGVYPFSIGVEVAP